MPARLKLFTTRSLLYVKYYKCKKFVVFTQLIVVVMCVIPLSDIIVRRH